VFRYKVDESVQVDVVDVDVAFQVDTNPTQRLLRVLKWLIVDLRAQSPARDLFVSGTKETNKQDTRKRSHGGFCRVVKMSACVR
jgi:hypothetical protein